MGTIELPEDIGIKSIKKFYIDLLEMLRREDGLTLDFSRVKSIENLTSAGLSDC